MDTGTTQKEIKNYCSAEFQLKNPGIFFQFKLWKNESEPMFAVVKTGSPALAGIKTGDVLPMTFHFFDKTIPIEKRYTRIKYIIDGNTIGFKDHVMIALSLDSAENNMNAEWITPTIKEKDRL